jgi:hypothetical protein
MNYRRFTLSLILSLSLLAASQTQHKSATVPAAKAADDAQLYRNSTFSFRYKIPYGWVERTQQMREQDAPEATDSPDTNSQKPEDPKKNAASKPQGEVLLAIFERPPDAIGDTVNSVVLIASESAAAYPGLKKAVDYLGPLTELTTSKGFKPEGDPDLIEIDGRQLVRADFSKALAGKTPNDELTMWQSTLVMLSKGQIVSFTFIGGSEDEIDNLIEELHFGTAKSSAH